MSVRLCHQFAEELIETARGRREPGVALAAHLGACEECAERWTAESALSKQLEMLRRDAAGRRSPEDAKRALLARFEQSRPARRAPLSRPWVWSFAAAAAVVLGLALAPGLLRPPDTKAPAAEQLDAAEEGFIAVPFVPPLADGEMVHLVHTELQAAELASLGVNVDPSLTAGLPADLLVGADGFPRAVRVSEEEHAEPGF